MFLHGPELTNQTRLAGAIKGDCLSLPPQVWDYKHVPHTCLVLVSFRKGSQVLVLAKQAFYKPHFPPTIMSHFLISKYLHTYTPLPTPLQALYCHPSFRIVPEIAPSVFPIEPISYTRPQNHPAQGIFTCQLKSICCSAFEIVL